MNDFEFESHLSAARGLARLKARAAVGQCGLTADDREDVESQLLLAIWVGFLKFDGQRSSRNTFTCRVMDKEISTIFRYRLAHRRLQLGRPDLVDGDAPEDVYGAAKPTTQRQEFWIDVSKAVKGLPGPLRTTILALCCGSPTEAAEVLGAARSVVYERIAQIRGAFLAAGIGPDYFTAGGAR